MSTITQIIQQGRRQIIAGEGQVMRQLLGDYQRLWQIIEAEIASLDVQIRSSVEQGFDDVTEAWVRRQTWFRHLDASIQNEIARFATQLETLVEAAQTQAVTTSARTTAAITELVPGAPRVNTNAFERWVSVRQPDSPLTGTLQKYGAEPSKTIAEKITEGIGRGRGSSTITREIVASLKEEMPEYQVARIVRTETMRAYRGSQRNGMEAMGPEVISGWEWVAGLSARSCGACLAMHGTVFPYEEYPDTFHPCCRCVIRPRVHAHLLPADTRPRLTGEQWLRRQKEKVQRQVLQSPERYEMWRNGMTLQQMTGVREDATWGDSVALIPLRDLREAA